jgi:hypothetical protein
VSNAALKLTSTSPTKQISNAYPKINPNPPKKNNANSINKSQITSHPPHLKPSPVPMIKTHKKCSVKSNKAPATAPSNPKSNKPSIS